jgi:hypothetical protein
MRLAELHAHFAQIGGLDALSLVIRVALAEAPPTNLAELARLRQACRSSAACCAAAAALA